MDYLAFFFIMVFVAVGIAYAVWMKDADEPQQDSRPGAAGGLFGNGASGKPGEKKKGGEA